MSNTSPVMSETISSVLQLAVSKKASDIHFKTRQVPAIRVNGEVIRLNYPILTEEEITAFVERICPSYGDHGNFLTAFDFSWEYSGSRFRCNVFRDMNGLCISIRFLFIISTDFAVLRIPEILKQFADKKSGLILITGPTGSGKTTTLTCLIDYINNTYPAHIVTLEDPIEYIHESKRSIISQREIGVSASSYEAGIVEALREDPDIILIGEMREQESINAALRAAETGHLVLSTLHTKGTANSISRIVSIYPPEEQARVCMQLSMCLAGVVSQQLVPRIDMPGLVLATEVMGANIPIRNLIRQQKIHMVGATLDLSGADGMYTMKTSLKMLLDCGIISKEDYERYQIS